jgi:hypothetical protein
LVGGGSNGDKQPLRQIPFTLAKELLRLTETRLARRKYYPQMDVRAFSVQYWLTFEAAAMGQWELT